MYMQTYIYIIIYIYIIYIYISCLRVYARQQNMTCSPDSAMPIVACELCALATRTLQRCLAHGTCAWLQEPGK